ncbi:MAG: Flp pilus assembly protein CpaB [Pseudomonadota bacterium]
MTRNTIGAERMKYLPALSLGLSVILGIAAFFILRADPGNQAAASEPIPSEVAAIPQTQTVEVLVAAQPIESGAPVLRELVDTVDWPKDLVPNGALADPRQLIGPSGDVLFAQSAFVVGEPLTGEKLALSPPRRMLSRDIPEGFRAVSIGVTNVTNVSGFVLPGDRVDLIAYEQVPGRTGPDAFQPRPLIDHVLVLGVDQFMGKQVQGALPASMVTFALKPEDARQVTAAARDSRIGLALIGQAETEAREAESKPEADAPARPAQRPAPSQTSRRAPPAPETTRVRVVHGSSSQIVTAPVEQAAPLELTAEVRP